MESQTSNAGITNVRVGNLVHVRVSGVIDETFPLASSTKGLAGLVLVDLGMLERISSFGVRRWIEFVGRPPADVSGLYVINAPPIVVDQLNMVEGFAGVARVLSLLAPYTCRFCKEDRLRLVNLVEEAKVLEQGGAPEHSCPVCAQPLEFADEPTEFFDFARRQQFSTVDPAVLRYLHASSPTEASELGSHLKLIQDDITFITLASTLKGDLNVRRLAAGLEGRVAFDCSHVAKAEAEALPRFEQVLETAAQGAQVYLCRVPPPMLGLLARSAKTLPVKLATLWLPCDCRNCGQVCHQRIQAREYLESLRTKGAMERVCPICGGTARAPALAQFQGILARLPLTEGPLEDIEGLEQRALSQYLFGSTNLDPASMKHSSPTDLNAQQSAKLQIIRRLGQGGMAEVFLARQQGAKGFEKYVVMKKILAQYAENPEFVDMLFAEARANARLTHPNVVQTFDVGVTDGVAYILMEYVRGPDLKRLLTELRRKGMALPLEHALRIVAEVAAGLHYAHSYVDPGGTAHPVVHRDVSPHNVLISLDGAIKLSDFGIAKVQGEEHTQAGVIKGKISYLSPEAASGRPLDWRNDVFALGVVLFELLTGQLPFRRDHDAATLAAIVREPAPVPSQLKPHIPQDVSDLILRALVKDPARRTPSAAAMREEIEAVIALHRLSSSPASVAQFFKDALGDRLAEYAPSSSGSGTGSHPKPLVPGAGSGSHPRALSPGSHSGASRNDMRAPQDASRPPVRGGSGSLPRMDPSDLRPPPAPPVAPMAPPPVAAEAERERTEMVPLASSIAPPARPTVAPPPPPVAPVASTLPPPTAVRPAAAGVVPTRVGPPPARPPAAAPPAVPPAMAPPPPAPVAAAPVAPHAHRPPPEPVAPAPAKPAAAARPASAGASSGTAPVAPRPPPAVAPVPDAASTPAAPPPSRLRTPLIIGGGGVLVAAVVAAVLLPSRGVEVLNAQEGERVYVSGVRLDPERVPPQGASGGFLVSTAVNGQLRRFGKVMQAERIDLRTLADAAPPPDSTGTLSVTGPSGCHVALGDKALTGTTPLASPLPAGREFEVRVTCDGKPDLVRWVMAVPGQGVALDVP